jgi:hypothetical protein
MVADNIHILNPGRGPSQGCVFVGGGQGVPWGLGMGQETYVTMPPGTYGGPVQVTVDIALHGWAVASQRIQFHSSFSELWAQDAAVAQSTSFFNWYDNASPGMVYDNIHVFNPSTSSASVMVSLPGFAPLSVTVGAGAEEHVAFPAGTIGGPVTVSSTQPVLASQRVQYYQTFNEEWAMSSAQANTTSFFNWYDKASNGVLNDNIHLLNPGINSANVTVSLPGASPQTVIVDAGAESYVNFPGQIGGPVTVISSQPMLASQRVQYYQSFNEVPALSAAQAGTTHYLTWYDKASPGMVNDNVHVLNAGTNSADVTVIVTEATTMTSRTVTVGPGAEAYVTFPAGTIGGPVTVTSTQPVMASQRVQYYQTFNEIAAL